MGLTLSSEKGVGRVFAVRQGETLPCHSRLTDLFCYFSVVFCRLPRQDLFSVDHGGEEIAGKCQLVLDEPQEMKRNKSQDDIEDGAMDIRDDPFCGGKCRTGERVQKWQGKPSKFQRGPENAGNGLQGKDQEEQGQVHVTSQPVVAGIGIRDGNAGRIGGRFYMMCDLFTQDLDQSFPFMAGIEIVPAGEGRSMEGKMKTCENQQDKGIAQDDMGLLEEDGLGFGESQELVIVENEIGKDEQDNDKQVRPVPEAKTPLPDGKLYIVSLRVVETGNPVVH